MDRKRDDEQGGLTIGDTGTNAAVQAYVREKVGELSASRSWPKPSELVIQPNFTKVLEHLAQELATEPQGSAHGEITPIEHLEVLAPKALPAARRVLRTIAKNLTVSTILQG